MATFGTKFKPGELAIGSHQTALCIIPPAHLSQDLDRLRSLYDKSHGKWPAHINLIYPFVAIDSLPQAVDLIRSKLVNLGPESEHRDIVLNLDKSDYFSHRHSSTIFVTASDGSGGQDLKNFRSTLLEAFKEDDDTSYHPHLTIGQSKGKDTATRDYLLGKANLLLSIKWRVEELVVLIRERTHGRDEASSKMKVLGTIELAEQTASQPGRPLDIQESFQTEEEWSNEGDRQANSGLSTDISKSLHISQGRADHAVPSKTPTPQRGITYQFSAAAAMWEPVQLSVPLLSQGQTPRKLTISSYNVLVDSIYPPARDRYALLLRSILSESALADILVLQEVSDDFLSYLLENEAIRSRYPFTTHGPPDQSGIGPLASLRNIIVLSRWKFSWDWVPFEMRHKGTVVLKLETVGISKDSAFLPLIVAGVHLTSGLTDDSVAAKKSQLQTLLSHLSRNYSQYPWIVAGDFNLTTSAFTIDAALKRKLISSQTATTISALETMISEARLSDSWSEAGAETRDAIKLFQGQMTTGELHEGEEGATFDPLENSLAAETVGRGSSNRPQRYDRILVRAEHFLQVSAFNMFGFAEEGRSEKGDDVIQDHDVEPRCGSDHWGIRTSLTIDPTSGAEQPDVVNVHQVTPLRLRKAPSSLADVADLKSCLAEHSMFPTQEEVSKRNEVFALVESVLQQNPSRGSSDLVDSSRANNAIVVVPVGSYALGVWNTSSDIDCLCIGSISAEKFFALAGQRLRKAADLAVRVLRTVNAKSGTMLELDVRGVKLDLQYCPATKLVEIWPEVIHLPPSDPAFDLPRLSLSKVNSFRDLDYLLRTIPDLAAFRIAHRFIRAWAKQQGIYSSKFGYLGGIHITLLLSRICKLLARDEGCVTASDIICTFFHEYANFDWTTQMAFGPLLYGQQRPRYHRSAREPMVVLSLHAPIVNVAHTSSLPSARTLFEELKRANDLLSEVGMTWPRLLGSAGNEAMMADLPSGAHEFLKSYNSYIKINVQYWGVSLVKGSSLVGWLESRCVALLVDLNRRLPDIHARIWPARFTLEDASGKGETDYEGCYLIGLTKRRETAETSTVPEGDRKMGQRVLWETLDQFATQIRNNEQYFDAASSWVDALHVKQAGLGNLSLDDREWGDHVIQEDESDTDEEADDETRLNFKDSDEEAVAAASSVKPKAPSTGKTSTTKRAASKPTKKLRPAADILHRLRWDPSLDAADHVVGYEDRFLGTREIALDRWKSEQTDDEFIPLHRVVYFRRRSDGVRVWERETRRDEVFGSGVRRVEGRGGGTRWH